MLQSLRRRFRRHPDPPVPDEPESRGDTAPEPVTSPEPVTAPEPVRLFVPPGHFYSPVPNPAEVERHLNACAAEGVPEALPGIALDRTAMVALWQRLVPLMQNAPFPESESPGFRYWFDNPNYSWGDGSVLHGMLRLFHPRRLIEVGSGWSSACSVDTIERHLGGTCTTTFIEPYPELLRRLLGPSASNSTILAKPVQEVPPETFDVLEANDVLFIDSTHVLRTGSDVWYELFRVLPRLKPGVVVHFHDIFWPFEYPHQWAVDENRGWNEAYALRAFLTDNPNWEILMFNDYMSIHERPLIEDTYPRFLRNTGGAIWLRRR